VSLADETGLRFQAVALTPPGEVIRLRPMRVGLWDQYGGSMPSGWTRWLLEQFEFPFEVVFPQELDAGDLASRYDVLIFVDGGIPARDSRVDQPAPSSIPAEYHGHLGRVSVSRTIPLLRRFVEEGGTLLTIGTSTVVGEHFGLPIRDALTTVSNGLDVPLPADEFFVPGAILEARVDNAHPLAYGLGERVKVFFDRSPAFRLLPDAAADGVTAVAWFDTATPLQSGWAWGQEHLNQAVQVVDARLGQGRVVLFAPEITWRGQPHGTFKLLFNGIYLGTGE
jgi:hypothetical protein